MTPNELRRARAKLGLTGRELGIALDVNDRTVRAWESGQRDDKPCPIPRSIAVLVRLALTNPSVRRELGIVSNPALQDEEIPKRGRPPGQKGRIAAQG